MTEAIIDIANDSKMHGFLSLYQLHPNIVIY